METLDNKTVDPTYTGMPKLIAPEVYDMILHHTKTGKATMVHGPMGIGKTSLFRQVAADIGWDYIEKNIVLDDLVELAGHYRANPETKRTERYAPEWLPSKPKTLMDMDDFNVADAMKQASMMSLLQFGKIGNWTMPEQCLIGATCNRKQDAVHIVALSAATKNKVWHCELVPAVEPWIKWALAHNIYPPFVAYIKWKGLEALYNFNPKSNLHCFPTPRSWEAASIDILEPHKPEMEFGMIAGHIGEHEAYGALGFVKTCRDLVNIDLILANPDTAPTPKDVNVRYMLAIGLSRRADRSNIGNILRYAARLSGEWETLTVLEAKRMHPEVTTTTAFVDYAMSHNWVN